MAGKSTLSRYERETIITFNEAEEMAYVFTYKKSWQLHMEKRLGLTPVLINEEEQFPEPVPGRSQNAKFLLGSGSYSLTFII